MAVRQPTAPELRVPALPRRPADSVSAGRAKRRRRRKESAWGYLFIGPQLFGMVAFVLGPMIFALVLSLTTWNGFGEHHFVGLQNFIGQFHNDTFLSALRNTAYYTILLVPGELACALVVALALNNVRGKLVYRLFYFMPVVTSSVAVSVVWTWLLNGQFGPINGYLRQWFGLDPPDWLINPHTVIPAIVVVSIWRGMGFTMVIFLAGLRGIPTTYLEAAQIDGANALQRFRHITLPMLSPTILFLSIVSFIGSFQVFDIVFVLSSGTPSDSSQTLVYLIYNLAFVKFQFGAASAVAVLLFGILLVLTLLQMAAQRRWVHYEE
jgi:multiple sugar transport system permease protein